MRKTLFIFIFTMIFYGSFAQNGALTVNLLGTANCDYVITMYGKCNCCGGGGCSSIVANQFSIPWSSLGTTYSWTDPCDFECGGSGVGFTTSVCSGCSSGCYAGGGALGWQWTAAVIDFNTGSCVYGTAGTLGTGYCGSASLSGSGGHYATWTESSTSPYDVTIDIY